MPQFHPKQLCAQLTDSQFPGKLISRDNSKTLNLRIPSSPRKTFFKSAITLFLSSVRDDVLFVVALPRSKSVLLRCCRLLVVWPCLAAHVRGTWRLLKLMCRVADGAIFTQTCCHNVARTVVSTALHNFPKTLSQNELSNVAPYSLPPSTSLLADYPMNESVGSHCINVPVSFNILNQ